MSVPSIEVKGNVYFLEWKEEMLTCTVSRIASHSDRVTCELVFRTTDPLYHEHLLHTAFNLVAGRSRIILAGQLAEVYNKLDKKQAIAIVEQLCVKVLNLYREGEPVQELWTNEEIAPPQFLLEPILYKGLSTIIFGKKATLKSTLSLAAYACLLLPWADNPMGWKAPNRSIKPLILDYEVDFNIIQWNAKRLQKGMGLPAFPIYYRRGLLPVADDIEALSKHVAKIGCEVIIIDSLGAAVGGDLKDPSQALRFSMALRQLKCGALIIGQTAKDEEGGKKNSSVYGSTFFEYYARNIFEVRKVQEEDEAEVDIALYNTHHNLGKRYGAQGFHVSFDDTSIRIKKAAITQSELLSRLGIGAQIKNLLQHGSMAPKDIAEELGVSEATVRGTLKRMREKNIVVKLDDNKYGLVLQ